MAEHDVPRFPCDALPAEPRLAKLLGLYPQRQDGRWLQRVRIMAGRLTGGQWRALADAAREFTPATPLHLTTRQDIELHDLPADAVPGVQRRLAGAGLTGLGGGGDTFRNITVCPCAGLANGLDLKPIAQAIQRTLWACDEIFSLPRKFKIALSCGADCGQPWINDLGLVAARRDGQWGFTVIVGGSLGPRPATGMLLSDWLAPREMLPLVLAAVAVFGQQGDRSNRSAARLRHVRQRLGDAAFADLIRAEVARMAAGRCDEPTVGLADAGPTAPAARRDLRFANGDVTAEQAEALALLADRPGLAVRITAEHSIAVFGPADATIAAAVSAEPALRAPAELRASVVACPGTRWCARGLADTNTVADAIRRALADGDHSQGRRTDSIRISGCPNGCAHTGVAAVGLSGRLATIGGQRQEVFDVLAGGGVGRDARLAAVVAAGQPPADAVRLVALRVAHPAG